MDKNCKQLAVELLKNIGEDPSREGLLKTPERFTSAFTELTVGYHQNSKEIVNGAIFSGSYSEMVMVENVEFYSLCEHHLLPFFGRVSVAYIPEGRIIGLSKIPRLINMFSRRLQVQERLTAQIADELNELLQPEGVACSIQAQHMCMMMRGAGVQHGSMVTNVMRGCFLEDYAARQEFLNAISRTKDRSFA